MHDENSNMIILSLKKLNPQDSDLFAPRGCLTNIHLGSILKGQNFKCVCGRLIVKVQLVTHSIMPNLGLVGFKSKHC